MKRTLEFIASLACVVVIAMIGAIISGPQGMFWFGAAAVIIAFIFLLQRKSFYMWIYVFLFVLMVIDKFYGLVNLA